MSTKKRPFVRVAAVVHHGGRLLLNRTPMACGAVFSLLGGHLEVGESAPHCLVREFKEELSWPLDVGELLFIGENLWREGDPEDPHFGETLHEICLYLRATVPAPFCDTDPKSQEEHLWPGWFAPEEVQQGELVPPFLAPLLEGKTITPPTLLSRGF
ncbi:NUDIX domain-containing protein [bacterium]|nr:NUDIX domain-containing protein [bacterium]